MKKVFLLLAMVLATVGGMAQSKAVVSGDAADVLDVARRVNRYFMNKHADPTAVTNVGRVRPSNLWTRAVYYEGLMALYELDANPQYIDYTDRWADFHKWTARNGDNTTDADDQCCEQTYIDRYMMTRDASMLEHVKANLEHQMGTGKYGYWTWIDAIQQDVSCHRGKTIHRPCDEDVHLVA